MGDKEQCRNLAEGLLPTLIQWFRASATPASLCSSAGVCGAAVLQVAALNKPALRVRDTTECAMCKLVVRSLQQQLEDSRAVDKIKEVALQICGSLPAELAAGCTDFVDNYAPLISSLVDDLDPDTVCALIGTCMEAAAAVPPPPIPTALVQALAGSQILRRPLPPPVVSALTGLPPPLFGPPGGPGGMMGAMMGHGGPGGGPMGMRPWVQGPADGDNRPWWAMLVPGGPMGQMANDACDYCKMAVLEAHSLVSDPRVQAELLNYTKAVCGNFPSFAEACKEYVDMYAPLLFSVLEQYLVPDIVCTQTGLCPPLPGGAAGTWAELQSAGSGSSSGSEPHHHSGRSWSCWLLDGWLGGLLRHLGLGAASPYQHQQEYPHGTIMMPAHEQDAAGPHHTMMM